MGVNVNRQHYIGVANDLHLLIFRNGLESFHPNTAILIKEYFRASCVSNLLRFSQDC